MNRFLQISLGLIILFAAGRTKKDPAVGPGMGKVSGTITHKGVPITQGLIFYRSDEFMRVSMGVISDGKYSLDPFELFPGTYVVYAHPPLKPEGYEDSDFLEIPREYAHERSSKLRAEVKEGMNTHEFDLE